MRTHTVTLIPGDGIGPEVIDATVRVINATGVSVNWETFHAGASQFRKGIPSGVPEETIASITRNRVVLKGPLETPVGFGEKSANVTLRKLFETYANVRPVSEFKGVVTPFSGKNLDLVVIRENVEDLYAGIEHRQTQDVAQCLKIITRPGCEKIVRFAFEYARANGRKKIHCATKANIMKMTEGLLKRTFEEIAKEYPEIESNHIIIDNCAHQLAKKPEQFDVIVTTNMNGDIISDLTSGLVGGLGFAPSANIGKDIAIFEAVHGSAPKYAGKNVINPTAAILSGAMMLRYLGETDAARRIEAAVRKTWENSRTQTRDIAGDGRGISTTALTEEIIRNLGPAGSEKQEQKLVDLSKVFVAARRPAPEQVQGIDVFVEFKGHPRELGEQLEKLSTESAMYLKMISNRGTKVYPGNTQAECVDHWRCRFMNRNGGVIADRQIYALLHTLTDGGVNWMHIEKLKIMGNDFGFTKAQGED